MTVWIWLSDEECRRAVDGGVGRYERRRAAGSQQRYGRDEKDHTVLVDIDACAAEIACGRAINRPWVDSPEPDPEGDLGPGVQVRQTAYTHGRLPLHHDSVDSHAFFLVVGTHRIFRVAGWIWAREGKTQRNWRSLAPGRWAFWVDQVDLHPVSHFNGGG